MTYDETTIPVERGAFHVTSTESGPSPFTCGASNIPRAAPVGSDHGDFSGFRPSTCASILTLYVVPGTTLIGRRRCRKPSSLSLRRPTAL